MAVRFTYHGSPFAQQIQQQGFKPGTSSNSLRIGNRAITLADLFQKGPKAFTSTSPKVASMYGSNIPVASSTRNLSLPSGGITSRGVRFGTEVVQTPNQFNKGMTVANKALDRAARGVSPMATRLAGGATVSGLGAPRSAGILSRLAGGPFGMASMVGTGIGYGVDQLARAINTPEEYEAMKQSARDQSGFGYFDDVDISQPPGTDVGIMNNLSNLTNLFGSSARADEIEPIDVENFLEANRLKSTPDVVDVNRIPGRIQEAVEPQYRIRDQLSRDFLQGGLFRDAKQGLGQTKNALLDDFGQLREGLGSITNRGMNLFDLAKDKGIDLGRTIASGIGRFAAGPIGGILGSLIGSIKESPTDKFNLEIGKEVGDPYGYKGQLSSGTMGGRQDPFGRNLVSAFGNYEKNRIAEVARLNALATRNKFQQAQLDFGKDYLDKLEAKRQAAIQERQAQNRADNTGGYQAGYGRDFMDGPSGTIGGQNQGLGGQQGKAGGTATMGSS